MTAIVPIAPGSVLDAVPRVARSTLVGRGGCVELDVFASLDSLGDLGPGHGAHAAPVTLYYPTERGADFSVVVPDCTHTVWFFSCFGLFMLVFFGTMKPWPS